MALLRLFNPNVKLPEVKSVNSTVTYLHSPETYTFEPKKQYLINTYVRMDGDWRGQVCHLKNHKSLYRCGLRIYEEILDEDNREDIVLYLTNESSNSVTVCQGQPIALFQVLMAYEIQETKEENSKQETPRNTREEVKVRIL